MFHRNSRTSGKAGIFSLVVPVWKRLILVWFGFVSQILLFRAGHEIFSPKIFTIIIFILQGYTGNDFMIILYAMLI
jgi:hypothetical protein